MKIGDLKGIKYYGLRWGVFVLGWQIPSLFGYSLVGWLSRFLREWWLHREGAFNLFSGLIAGSLYIAWCWWRDRKAAQKAHASSLPVQTPPTKVHRLSEYTPAARKLTRKLKQ